MNIREIKYAIEHMKAVCDRKMQNYESVSARKILTDSGYSRDDTQQVLEAIAEAGFSYCLDSSIKCSDGLGGETYPAQQVCIWGPDQLKSRLNSLDIA